MVFTPSPVKGLSAAAIGLKRASIDVFGTGSEESASSDEEANRVELGPQHFKKQELKPVAVTGDARIVIRENPLKEKPIQSVTRLLSNIVANQKVVLDRLPAAIKVFEEVFAADLTTIQKVRVKKYLGKENNAEIFLLLSVEKKSETIFSPAFNQLISILKLKAVDIKHSN